MRNCFTICLTVLLFATVPFQSISQPVYEKAARTCAYQFMQSKQMNINSAEELLSVPVPGVTLSNPEVYIYNHPQQGFVIVSGDQNVVPIIGYSNEGFIPLGQWRSNFASWISQSIAQVGYFRQTQTKSNSEIDDMWNFLLSGVGANPFVSSKAVLPLLRSTWAQDGSFNDMCPEDVNGEALVGCVATAMAQIMYYYRYPNTGNGSHSYNPASYPVQSVNFGTSTYNYYEMMGNLSVPAPEVAELSYHCGVAVDMDYGVDGSGSYTWLVEDAIEDYFRYSSDASYKNKSYGGYTNTTWKNLIRTNIDALHPVMYSGSGSGGGHAFITDGYEGTDYFHFDWGWSGYANGYYYIGSLNPAGSDFDDDNQAIVNFYPPTTSYPYGCSGTTTLTSTFGTIEDGSGPVANYEANASCSWLISPAATCDYFKINFEELDIASDDQVTIYAGANSSAPVTGTYTGSTLPSQITVSSSQVFIQFVSNASNHSKGFLLNYSGHVPLSCSGIQNLTLATDTFDDGSGSNHYGNSSFCRWNIAPSGASSITVHFLQFSLGDEYDYVKVIDAISGDVKAEYHQGDNPTSVTVNTSKVTIMFQSNTSLTADGFELYYTTTTGFDESPAGLSMRIYPNPASDLLQILPGDGSATADIRIFDFSGRMVYSAQTNGEILIIDAGQFAPGIYQVGLISSSGQVWQKIVIE